MWLSQPSALFVPAIYQPTSPFCIWSGHSGLFIFPGPLLPALLNGSCCPSCFFSLSATGFCQCYCWVEMNQLSQAHSPKCDVSHTSPGVFHQLGIGDVSTTLLVASSTDISSCAKHVSVTPKFSMPVTIASLDTAQAERLGKCSKNTLLCSKRD